LSPLEAQPLPQSIVALKAEIGRAWPMSSPVDRDRRARNVRLLSASSAQIGQLATFVELGSSHGAHRPPHAAPVGILEQRSSRRRVRDDMPDGRSSSPSSSSARCGRGSSSEGRVVDPKCREVAGRVGKSKATAPFRSDVIRARVERRFTNLAGQERIAWSVTIRLSIRGADKRGRLRACPLLISLRARRRVLRWSVARTSRRGHRVIFGGTALAIRLARCRGAARSRSKRSRPTAMPPPTFYRVH
jgi:hypothetical protein